MIQLNWYKIFGVQIPDGSTVLPTDDIQIWLHCANIWNKAYTTLAEVLADSTTLSALISDNNATDYLVRSTTWASGMCADSTAMTYIGLNNYCANKLLNDATWRTAICTSAYKENVLNVKTPDMTGFNTPSGLVSASSNHPTYPNYYVAFNDYPTQIWVSPDNTTNQWLQYKFDNAVKVICFEIEVTFVIGGVEYARTSSLQLKGSADGNTFTFVENYSLPAGVKKLFVTTNNDSMAYWRMVVNGFNMHYNADNCLICIIRYYGREDV